MINYTITATDCYGYLYDVETFDSITEVKNKLASLYDSLDDASGSIAYRLRAAISELEAQLLDSESLSA